MLTICDPETYIEYMKDDPVRPELFEDNSLRFRNNFHVFADIDIEEGGGHVVVNAILCAVISPFVLQCEELLRDLGSNPEEARQMQEHMRELLDDANLATIFTPYSMWSYKKGSGKRLINQLLEYIPIGFPKVTHVITMSPPTRMAMEFHINNGALLLSPNAETINYEYNLNNVTLH